ncbi:MAG: geranylgeranylglyceryl/heptaprenylglyceryl phosphate synthase [Candidatus Thermoplasmatota archaeon]|nr:geranylgeranylglyceryl/heptaprenylglyceryl phosphate synthase [Candidatus Thermoplasmatota archaeon]
MKIIDEILEAKGKKKLHMTLIDPASQSVEKSGKIAKEAGMAGSDYILIGGSTSVSGQMVDATVVEVKKASGLKTILFPGSAEMISGHADAIFFMSLLNSRNIKFIMGYQVSSARFVKSLGIETIPMGYIVFEPGMTVGKVGEANLVGREDRNLASSYVAAAELLGMRLVYLEAGSGAPQHIPPETIDAAKREVSIPVIVGGGIRTPSAAEAVSRAGADIIVTGTVAERASSILDSLAPIIRALKGVS